MPVYEQPHRPHACNERESQRWEQERIYLINEFLFRMKKKFLTYQELEEQMDEIISKRVKADFAYMDSQIKKGFVELQELDEYLNKLKIKHTEEVSKRSVEVYDQRQKNSKTCQPTRSLGRMPIGAALAKFK